MAPTPKRVHDAWLDRSWLILLSGFVITLAPLWFAHAVWTWQAGHYQYYPLMWLLVGLLYRGRMPDARDAGEPACRAVVITGLSAVLVTCAAGLLLYSGFIGVLATIGLAWVLTYAMVGRSGTVLMAPVLALLAFVVPLPMGLDKQLIFQMQFAASHLATWLLDGAGVMHVREGVILITERAHYMTEEACSGVRSLFSSLALVATYAVAMRHGWLRLSVNLLQCIGWVLAGNAIRVALTVVLADGVSPWFAAGIGHELLSLAMFGFILAMVASTDQILGAFFETQLNINYRGDELGKFADETVARRYPRDAASSPRTVRLPPIGRTTFASFMVAIAVLGVVGLRVSWVKAASRPTLAGTMPELPAPREDNLPAGLAGWQKVDFEHVTRKRSSLFARDSYVWRYRNGSLIAMVSVDAPWAEWHNLKTCYAATGWECQMRTLQAGPPDDSTGLTHAEIELSRRDRKRGLVIFSSVDAEGRDVRPPWRNRMGDADGLISSLGRQAVASLGLGLDRSLAVEGLSLPTTTIQIYSERSGEYREDEAVALRDLFFAAREALVRGPRWSSDASPVRRQPLPVRR